MAAILALLLTIPFVRVDFRKFLVFYAFALWSFKEVRYFLMDIGLTGNGEEFFDFYSSAQFVLVIGALFLLTGWQRITSIALFLLFSIYNKLIFWYWTEIPLTGYDTISQAILFTHVFFATMEQKFWSRDNFLVTFMSMTTYFVANEFL